MKIGKVLIVLGAGLIAAGGILSATGSKDIKSFLRGNKNIRNIGKQVLGEEKVDDILSSGVIDQISDAVSKDALPMLGNLAKTASKVTDSYAKKGVVIKGFTKIDEEVVKNSTKKLKGNTVYIDTSIDGRIKDIKITKGAIKKLEEGVTKIAFLSDNQITIFKKSDLLSLTAIGKLLKVRFKQLDEVVKGNPYIVPSYAYDLGVDDKNVKPEFTGDILLILGEGAEDLKVGLYKNDGLKNVKASMKNGKVVIREVKEKQYPYVYK